MNVTGDSQKRLIHIGPSTSVKFSLAHNLKKKKKKQLCKSQNENKNQIFWQERKKLNKSTLIFQIQKLYLA